MTDLYAAMEQAGTRGYNIAVDGRYHSHRGTYRGALELMRQLRDMFPLRAQNRITATDCFNGEVWQG